MRTIQLALAVIATLTCTVSAEDPSAQQVLDRAIKAAGGARSLARLKSPMMWMERGTFYGMDGGSPFVAQYSAKWPDWYRQEVEGAFAITVSGQRAWVTTAASAQKLDGSVRAEQLMMARRAWAERLFPLAEDDYQLERVEGIAVSGRSTVAIRAVHPKQREMTFYFDAETYLIAKLETMVVSPQHGPEPVLSEAYYSAHKSFSGVKIPAKVKLHYDGKLFVDAEVVDYKLAATLDPDQFREPN